MAYFLSPALAQLRSEVNTAWPGRDKSSDGWIGDASHAAAKSDHNPDYTDVGIVRAIDVDKDGIDVDRLIATAIGDRRTSYVIHNRRIWQNPAVYKTGGWLPYTGTNPHTTHVHISVRSGHTYDRDTSPWGLTTSPTTPPTPPEDIMATRAELQADLASAIAPVMAAIAGTPRLFRIAGTDGAYMDLGAARRGVSAAQYAAMTPRPTIRDLAPSDPFWSLPLIGPPSQAFKLDGDPTGAVWYITRGGRRHVDAAEYAADSRPALRVLPSTHPIWALPVIDD